MGNRLVKGVTRFSSLHYRWFARGSPACIHAGLTGGGATGAVACGGFRKVATSSGSRRGRLTTVLIFVDLTSPFLLSVFLKLLIVMAWSLLHWSHCSYSTVQNCTGDVAGPRRSR